VQVDGVGAALGPPHLITDADFEETGKRGRPRQVKAAAVTDRELKPLPQKRQTRRFIPGI
jgi:hypothetical protein